MPIERILIRIMTAMSFAFILLTLAYYPPSHVVFPVIFFMLFVTAELILPSKPQTEERKPARGISKRVYALIILGILVCLVCLALLWKMGPYGRL